MRNTTVPEVFEELRDVTAEFIDQPIICIRRFVDDVMDQISRVPDLVARPVGAEPIELNMQLTIAVHPAVSAKHDRILARLEGKLRGEPDQLASLTPPTDRSVANPLAHVVGIVYRQPVQGPRRSPAAAGVPRRRY